MASLYGRAGRLPTKNGAAWPRAVTVLAERVGGRWLSGAFSVGGIMCMISLYANTIITSEVSLQVRKDDEAPFSVWLRLSALIYMEVCMGVV